MSNYIGSNEAARILGIRQRSILGLLKRGTLKGQKLGREWMIDKDSVLAYRKSKASQQSSDEDLK